MLKSGQIMKIAQNAIIVLFSTQTEKLSSAGHDKILQEFWVIWNTMCGQCQALQTGNNTFFIPIFTQYLQGLPINIWRILILLYFFCLLINFIPPNIIDLLCLGCPWIAIYLSGLLHDHVWSLNCKFELLILSKVWLLQL